MRSLPLSDPLLSDVGLLGYLHEHLQEPTDRRRRGAHYTSPELAREVVLATLTPLLKKATTRDALMRLRVCDPAMGAGVFLLEACRVLAAHLREVVAPRIEEHEAMRLVAGSLRGVDLDPRTVWVARRSLWLLLREPALPLDFADGWLREGDALAAKGLPFPGEQGFDAFVGNPPWVSYAGRAAQPLLPARRADYAQRFRSFRGYRNLQGLFVERCARELAPGGRMGLILPSSMAELSGYAPVRAEHDRWCEADRDLPDIEEDAFAEVFQPSMVLLSTRRAQERADAPGASWPLRRTDLDEATRALLERFSGPLLPPQLFGERGLQTQRGERRHLRGAPDSLHTVAVSAGSDLRPFALGDASYHAPLGAFGERLKSGVWSQVKVLIRQTARYPMAARSDGRAFRNSILAGFEEEGYPADFLVAYLNSTPVRWLHYLRNRDARMGIPQVKIGHLRALPAPPAPSIPILAELGGSLSRRNEGISTEEQERLDREVIAAFGLREDDLRRMQQQLPASASERAEDAPQGATTASRAERKRSTQSKHENPAQADEARKLRCPGHDLAASPGSRRVDPGT